jgi:hypothetical protein
MPLKVIIGICIFLIIYHIFMDCGCSEHFSGKPTNYQYDHIGTRLDNVKSPSGQCVHVDPKTKKCLDIEQKIVFASEKATVKDIDDAKRIANQNGATVFGIHTKTDKGKNTMHLFLGSSVDEAKKLHSGNIATTTQKVFDVYVKK